MVPVRTAEDVLVLKWAALHLQASLRMHPACTHTKGNGGCAGATRRAEWLWKAALTVFSTGRTSGAFTDIFPGRIY